MSLMVLKRFKNELIILLTTIFAIYAIYYKHSMEKFVAVERESIRTSIDEVNRVAELKRVWKSKQISKRVQKLKSIVPKNRLKSFKKRGQKVIVKYSGLNTKEINRVIKEIMNSPFQIVRLKMDKNGSSYSMELICRW